MQLSIPITLAICGLSLAASPVGHALEFEQYPALRYFSAEMTEKHGFSLNQLEKTFQCARIRPEIVSAMERPKELLPWYEYKKIFLTDENVRRGVEFWKKHAEVLARAQKQYGVSPEIVIAILGVETHFGRNLGNYPILDALATLMLDYPPRSAFFRQELAEFLLLTRELDINPCELKGSYAGAMGLPQFIPSSYRQ
jgi:membrane-bound lytic murein transglycosylase B